MLNNKLLMNVFYFLFPIAAGFGVFLFPIDLFGFNLYFFRQLMFVFILLYLPVIFRMDYAQLDWLTKGSVAVFLIWTLWGALSLSWAPSLANGAKEVVLIASGMVMVVYFTVLSNTINIAFLRNGWVVALALTCFIGVWELITGNHLANQISIYYLRKYNILMSTFGNPNTFAAFIMLALPFAWWGILTTQKIFIKSIYVIVSLLAIFIVYITVSRLAILALFLQIFLGLAVCVYKKIKLNLNTCLYLALVIVSYFIVSYSSTFKTLIQLPDKPSHFKTYVENIENPTPAISKENQEGDSAAEKLLAESSAEKQVEQTSRNETKNLSNTSSTEQVTNQEQKGTSLTYRLNLTLNGLYFFYLSKGLGVGAAGFEHYIKTSENILDTSFYTNAHNHWVEILAEYGILVFAAIVAFGVYLLTIFLKEIKQNNRPVLGLMGVMLFLIYGIVSAAPSGFIPMPMNWMALASMVAIARIIKLAENSHEKNDRK